MKKLIKTVLMCVLTVGIVTAGVGFAGSLHMKTEPAVSSLSAGPVETVYNDANSWHSYRAGSYAEGSGNGLSAVSAFKIENAEQLALMAYQINNNINATNAFYFELISDIELSAHYWIPIGNYRSAVAGVNLASRSFFGNFNGNGYKIKGLYIGNPDESNTVTAGLAYAGLFGHISSAEISDVTVECFIKNSLAGGSYIGGIAGYVNANSPKYAKITDCGVEGKIITENPSGTTLWSTGGLVGKSYNLIINYSYNAAKITAHSAAANFYVGGLIGDVRANTEIYNSYNEGEITGEYGDIGRVGGLVSYVSGGLTIENCFSSGNIYLTNADESTSSSAYAGGLFGLTANTINIKNSYCTGNVTVTGSAYYAGGLVGSVSSYGSLINNCYATGDISVFASSAYLGNLAGAFNGILQNSYYYAEAKLTYGNSLTKLNRAIGNQADVGQLSKTDAEMKSQALVDLLNNDDVNGPWVKTAGFPDLKTISRHVIIFHYIDSVMTDNTIAVKQHKVGNYILPEQPVLDGYTFSGWWTEVNGGGVRITKDDAVNPETTDLYAYWIETVYYFNFAVELIDMDGNRIDGSFDTELISTTNVTLSGTDSVNNKTNGIYNIGVKESGYRFLRFEIDGKTVDLNNFAEYFEDYGTSGTEPFTTYIVIQAIYIEQFTLSFTSENNDTLQGNGTVTINQYDKSGEIIVETFRKFFDKKYFDKGTKFSISIFEAPGQIVESKNVADVFTLENNIDISIAMGADTNAVALELQSNIDSLMPYKESDRDKFLAAETNAGKILTYYSREYTLTGWEVYINDNENLLDGYEFSNLDENLNILDLNIFEIIDFSGQQGINKIILKAIWEQNISINISYVDSSSPEMGTVEIYKSGQKINIEDVRNGDIITFKLLANPHYEAVNNNGFMNGERTIMVNGITEVLAEFKAITYTVTSNNKNAKITSDEIIVGKNIIINLGVGFGSDVDKNSLKVEIKGKPVEDEFIEIRGNSLIIKANAAFLSGYEIDGNEIGLNIDFSTKMNGLLIGIISGSSILIVAAGILILLYVMALKKRKVQLQKAEEQHRIGTARLSASDTIKNLRDEG